MYRVLSVPNINTVNVVLSLTGGRTVVDGVGIGFTLKTMRVAQASDAISLPYVNQILPGNRIWVDDNGSGLWEVLQKHNPFTERTVISPVLLDATEQYGAAIAQCNNRTALFVGSPRYGFASGTAQGGVYLYVKGQTDQYTPISPIPDQDTVLTLATTGVTALGSSLSAGATTYAVAGAPGSATTGGYAAVLWRDPAAGRDNTSPWVINQL